MEKPSRRRRERTEEEKSEDAQKRAKTPSELNKLKLDYLLKNIEKPVSIPEPAKEKGPPKPPEFVRNVVGSSAGAGSAEFHIYRNNRKREIQRLEYIEKQAKKEELDKEFEERRAERQKLEEERTAKKRAKRLKKKKGKHSKKQKKNSAGSSSDESEEGETEQDTEEDGVKNDNVTNLVSATPVESEQTAANE